MNLVLGLDRINKKIDSLQDTVQRKNWNMLKREALVSELDESLKELSGLEDLLQQFVKELKKQASIEYLKADEFFFEFKKTIEFLERNLKLEKEKGEATPMEEINVFESAAVPELYAELQRKILSQIIKARFLLERMNIASQKQETRELEKKSVARRALDLLEEREEELQELKEKYADIRRKSFLGMIQEKNVVDLEEKLKKENILLEKTKSSLDNRVKEYSRKLLALQKEFIELNREKNILENAFEKYLNASNELIPMLKKERDFAKKLVLDIENETLRLREHYSRELMNFEKAKQEVQEETEQRFERILKELKTELFEKEKDAVQLKKTIESLLSAKKATKQGTKAKRTLWEKKSQKK